MVRLSRFELETHCLEGSCSIHLSYRRGFMFMVGAVRFELTAPWSQTKCATAALRPGQTTQMDAL